jgi:hypothetical protein
MSPTLWRELVSCSVQKGSQMDRSNDPVWLAFEQEPRPNTPPRTAEEEAARQRGLADMRAGRLVDVEAEIAKLRATR